MPGRGLATRPPRLCTARRLALVGLLLVCAPATRAAGQTRVLELGVTLQDTLAPGQRHEFELALTAGDFAELRVDQQSLDVALTVTSPDGTPWLETDVVRARNAPETVWIDALQGGTYRVALRPAERGAGPGRYALRLHARRARTAADDLRIEAQRLVARGRAAVTPLRAATLESARDAFARAAELAREAGEGQFELAARLEQGATLLRLDPAAARRLYRELRLRAQDADARLLALALGGLGDACMLLDALDEAGEASQAALALWRAAGDAREQALAMERQAGARLTRGEVKEGRALYEQALAQLGDVQDARGRSLLGNGLGLALAQLGDVAAGRERLLRALADAQTAGDDEAAATVRFNLGLVEGWRGDTSAAREALQSALATLRTVGNRYGEAAASYVLAMSDRDLGQSATAAASFRRALELFRELGDRTREASVLTQLARLEDRLGDTQAALRGLEQARAAWAEVGNVIQEADTRVELGRLLLSLQRADDALPLFEQALAAFRAHGVRRSEAAALTSLGEALATLGRPAQAIPRLMEALALQDEIGDAGSAINARIALALAERGLGRPAAAVAQLETALAAVRAKRDRQREARALRELGATHVAAGDASRAGAAFEEALGLCRAHGYRPCEALALGGLARAEAARGRTVEAQARVSEAILLLEGLRGQVARRDLRSSYSALLREHYDLAVELQMRLHAARPDAGFDARALETAERARARGLVELLAETQADLRSDAAPELVAQERALLDEINTRSAAQTRALAAGEDDVAGGQSLEVLLARYEDVQARLRESSPRYAALTRPAPVGVAELRAGLLDADTTLLEYALGTPRSFLWAVTRDGLRSFVLPPRDEIEALTGELLERLRAPRGRATPPGEATRASSEALAARLAGMLLGPLGERPTRRLLVVPDGLLQALPFALLPWPGTQPAEALVVHHELVSLPSAGTLALLRNLAAARAPARREVLVVADPVFDAQDERVRGALPGAAPAATSDATRDALTSALGVQHLPRLPLTRREAEALRRAVPETRLLLGFAARREALIGSALESYRIVHLATHGLVHAAQPALSGVALSLVDERGAPLDGFLRLHDLYDLRLSADLVVLSACQTALGRDLRGEGVMSLARGFMHAGASRVLASLWQVHDEATAALMTAFYDALLRRHMSPAAALREAQLTLLRSRRWRAPYYWAAFTLQGEW